MNAVAKNSTLDRLIAQQVITQEEKAKSLAIFLSIGEGVIVTDQYGKIEQVNDRALEILGYKKNEMVGQWFTSVVRAVREDGSKIVNLDRSITKTFISGVTIKERSLYLSKHNLKIPVDISVAPVKVNGLPIGAIEVFRDMSGEYAQEKVQGEFISVASHQLRTPLTSINTYAQMLSEGYAGALNEQQELFVKIIENSARRMNELIHILLNVTRLEAGNINVSIKPTDFGQIIKEVISEVAPKASDKEITTKFSNRYREKIYTDPLLVREVISNLLSNAIKYTPPQGKIVMSLSLRPKASRVIFSIRDNGYGIPLSAQAHIFSKFYRAKNAVKNDVSGTGLGLYLVKQIVETIDGDLWFNSKTNQGSTFYFALPAVGSSNKTGKFTLE